MCESNSSSLIIKFLHLLTPYTSPNLNTHKYYLHKSLLFLPRTPPFKNKCSRFLSITRIVSRADVAMVHWLCAQPSLYLFIRGQPGFVFWREITKRDPLSLTHMKSPPSLSPSHTFHTVPGSKVTACTITS